MKVKKSLVDKIIREEVETLKTFKNLREERKTIIALLNENDDLDENYLTKMLGMELTPKNAESKIYKRAKAVGMLNSDESWTPGTEEWKNRILATIKLKELDLTWEPAIKAYSTYGGSRVAIADL